MRRDDRAIRWQSQAAPRVGESKPDWEIWIELAHAMGTLDRRRPARYWTANFPLQWRDYKELWAVFTRLTPGASGMSQERLAARAEPLRWPAATRPSPTRASWCPTR